MRYNSLLLKIIIVFSLSACSDKWLDVKPKKSLIVPETLKDADALLNNTVDAYNNNFPCLGEMSADNYYLQDITWKNMATKTSKNTYLWMKDLYDGEVLIPDWSLTYNRIFYSNVALEIAKSNENAIDKSQLNNITGTALFCRSFDYFNLVQEFSAPYDFKTSGSEMGVPLILSSDINTRAPRSSLSDCFELIVNDAQKAASLLPEKQNVKTRPSKASAFALLSRIYLSMRQYDSSLTYATRCLSESPALIDYNSISQPTATYPFQLMNQEVLYHAGIYLDQSLRNTNAILDSLLYKSYNDNDLRKTLFFRISNGQIRFRGNYTGNLQLFGGLAVDEVLLTKAECNARLGNINGALSDINLFLSNRIQKEKFQPIVLHNSDSVLQLILSERRKELLFRGVRWMDLRRLNLEDKTKVLLTRIIDGKTYLLSPGDKRYVLPIPDDEIRTSGIQQNPR